MSATAKKAALKIPKSDAVADFFLHGTVPPRS